MKKLREILESYLAKVLYLGALRECHSMGELVDGNEVAEKLNKALECDETQEGSK